MFFFKDIVVKIDNEDEYIIVTEDWLCTKPMFAHSENEFTLRRAIHHSHGTMSSFLLTRTNRLVMTSKTIEKWAKSQEKVQATWGR